MKRGIDWTKKLGYEMLSQQPDVMDAIQRQRKKAEPSNKSRPAKQQRGNALVIGNGGYKSAAALRTPNADASIVAKTLLAAGYEVTELHDISKADIRPGIRDFLDKVAAGGSGTLCNSYFLCLR